MYIGLLYFSLLLVFSKKKMYTFSLAQKYCDEVANPMEMIIFRKIKSTEKSKRAFNDDIDDMDDITELFQADVKNILVFLY